MTKISFKPSTATVGLDDLSVIRFTSLADLKKGECAYVMLHDEKEEGTIRRVMSHDVPSGALNSWERPAVLNVQGRGKIEFFCHDMAGPEFPVFSRPKKIGDGVTNERVTVYIETEKFDEERTLYRRAVKKVAAKVSETKKVIRKKISA